VFDNRESLVNYILEKYGNDSSQGLYYSTLTVCPIDVFYDDQIQDFIKRHLFCEKFNVQPFPGFYDDQPGIWLDFVSLMLEEIPKCEKERNRLGK
jgi:hypothetical protein